MTAPNPRNEHGVAGLDLLVALPFIVGIIGSVLLRGAAQLDTNASAHDQARLAARAAALDLEFAAPTDNHSSYQVSTEIDQIACAVRATVRADREVGPFHLSAGATHIEPIDRFTEFGVSTCGPL